MDFHFCRTLVLFCVFTGWITCHNPLQILGEDTRKAKHHAVEVNINYLVPDNGGKRTSRTPPYHHLMKFDTRRRLFKRSGSSDDDRPRKRLKSGSLASDKVSDAESDQITITDRVRSPAQAYKGALRNPKTEEFKPAETNRKHDEFTKQITRQREDNTRNDRVQSGFKSNETVPSPDVILNQLYVDFPIYEKHNQGKIVDGQNDVTDLYRYQVKEESKDGSQSSEEKRKDEIRPNLSGTSNSRKKTGTKRAPRKRPRTHYKNSSPENDSSRSDESENVRSSTEDHSKRSKESRKEGASATLKTHVFTLTTQSVDTTAPSTIFTSSFGKVTTSYSTIKGSRRTVKTEITKEILGHRETTPEVPGVTSSTVVTTVGDFPTSRRDSGQSMLTELELTTKAFFATKSPQTETRRGTTTTIRLTRVPPKDPVTIGPVKDFITNQGSIPLTIVGIVSASIVAVAMIATSSFIGSRRSYLIRGRSPSLATLPENIELQGV